ncbi:MAG: adenosylcobinamide-GDP ribazoletransferase [Desulfobacterales bacterium]|nr:adenosylcobinamide-GDP ribazoletransferase [Desulfobacterales bacterium]
MGNAMKGFISAIQFMTVLPVWKTLAFQPGKAVPFFPAVGLLLGGMLCGFDMVASRLWSPEAAAVLDVVFLAAVTGALHLDGLGDAADGLYGSRPREKALAIMKDSRVGAMGLVAVVCGLAVKWGGVMGLGADRAILLIIIPAYARAGTLFAMKVLPYGRPEGGTGSAFFGGPMPIHAFWAVLLPAAGSLLLGWRALWLNLAFLLLTAAIIYYYKKKIGCITGDMLGAMIEVLESALFLLAAAQIP